MSAPLEAITPTDRRARVAIDLGAESCRVSLLRWVNGRARIELMLRIANGPVQDGDSMRWPLDEILAGIDVGLRKCAAVSPEGIASIGVDGWAVDYVRLDRDGKHLYQPFCYRDERTVAAKAYADSMATPTMLFRRTGAQPLRINTLYQLLADKASGVDPRAPWICLPEYVLHRLGGRRVAEYTNATHTGLVDVVTGAWCPEVFKLLDIPIDAAPPIVPSGSVVGRVQGPLAELHAFRDTQLIAPACHDTASAIAGIGEDLSASAYISCGTWSLVGTLVETPVTSEPALEARFTNQGTVTGNSCFHVNVNGMWLLKQCMEIWNRPSTAWTLEALIEQAALRSQFPGVIDVDIPELMIAGDMPRRINEQLKARGFAEVPFAEENAPVFVRVILESLAHRYAESIHHLRLLTDRTIERIVLLGGASRNRLLQQLTARETGLPVQCCHPESSTIGNFAVQLAVSDSHSCRLEEAVRTWAKHLGGRSADDSVAPSSDQRLAPRHASS